MKNAVQRSAAASDIATEMAGVNHASSGISDTSGQVDLSAKELSKLAIELKQTVGRFKIQMEFFYKQGSSKGKMTGHLAMWGKVS